MIRLAIVLPTLNEEKGLQITIEEIVNLDWRNWNIYRDILVVDSMSQDATQYVAHRWGATLITAPRGKGNAICYAWNRISRYDYAIMLDSDGTYPAEYISPMLHKLVNNSCDIVAGARILQDKEAMTTIHRAGNWCFTFTANLLYRTKTPDLCTGYWGFSKKAMLLIQLTAKRFELEANIFTEMNRNKLRFSTIPIVLRPRVKGEMPKIKFKDSFDVEWELIRGKFRK